MIIINLLICSGVLWALLIIFNESGSFKTVQQEAMLIIGMVAMAGVVVALLLPAPFDLLSIVAQAAVVFYGTEHISQLSRSAAIRVTAWFFGITFTIGGGFALLQWALSSTLVD